MNILSISSCFVFLIGFQLIRDISALSCYHEKVPQFRCTPPTEKVDCAELYKSLEKNTRSSGASVDLKRIYSFRDLNLDRRQVSSNNSDSDLGRNFQTEMARQQNSPDEIKMEFACYKQQWNEGFAIRICTLANKKDKGCNTIESPQHDSKTGITLLFTKIICYCFTDDCNSARRTQPVPLIILTLNIFVNVLIIGFKF